MEPYVGVLLQHDGFCAANRYAKVDMIPFLERR